MKFNILIPMAGEARRFNYKFKPFLKISDMLFIEYVFIYFNNYKSYINNVFFTVTREQYDNNNVKNIIKDIFSEYNYKIIILEKKTTSQLMTIKNSINNEKLKGPFLICDCDHSIDVGPMIDFLKTQKICDIILPIWNIKNEDKKKWGKVYITKSTNKIKSLCEKEINNIVDTKEYGLIGCYFFKNIEILSKSNETNISYFINNNIEKYNIEHILIKNASFFGDIERTNNIIENNRKQITIFCDLDGIIILHEATPDYKKQIILKGVHDKFKEFKNNNIKVIITTSRKKRKNIVDMLAYHNIYYDQLITDISSGPRILINDIKPSFPFTLQSNAINLIRNEGISTLNINIFNYDKIVKELKGGSFSKVYLIKKEKEYCVRKIIFKNSKNIIHYDKLKLQCFNLKRLNAYIPNICPNILEEKDNDYYYYYDMTYLDDYNVLFDLLDNSQILMNLFDILNENIYSIKKINNNRDWINNFINNEININEYEILSKNIRLIMNMEKLLINGLECEGLKILLKKDYSDFNPKFLTVIHGDLTFENILYNKNKNHFNLIDMDGANFIDAPELDLGKLLQSDISKYERWSNDSDLIKYINYDNNIIDTKIYINSEKIDNILNKYDRWKTILEIDNFEILKRTGIFYMVLHLLRMIPFRFNKSENQAIYAIKESIYWLNYIRKI